MCTQTTRRYLDFFFGSVLASCRNCPKIKSSWVVILCSVLNSWHVFKNVGYSSGKTAWSNVGNKWCKPWSPKFVKTLKSDPFISTLSMTAYNWWTPQSRSSLKDQTKILKPLCSVKFSTWRRWRRSFYSSV